MGYLAGLVILLAHQGDPARFLSEAMVRELREQVDAPKDSSPPRSSGSSTRDFISSGRMGTNGWNYDRGASARARRVAAALLLVGLVSREGET